MKLLISLFFSLLISHAYSAEGGGESVGTRGGGNDCSRDFALVGQFIYDEIKYIPFYQTQVNLDRFVHLINYANIRITDSEIRDENGNIYDGQNDPKRATIYVNKRWCDQRFQKPNARFVFHEFLGLVDPKIDSTYLLSKRLFEKTTLSDDIIANLLLSSGKERRLMEVKISGDIVSVIADSLIIKSIPGCFDAGTFFQIFEIHCAPKNFYLKISTARAVKADCMRETFFKNVDLRSSDYFIISSANECEELKFMALNNATREKLVLKLGLRSRTLYSFEQKN
jgi:hypothetical protein